MSNSDLEGGKHRHKSHKSHSMHHMRDIFRRSEPLSSPYILPLTIPSSVQISPYLSDYFGSPKKIQQVIRLGNSDRNNLYDGNNIYSRNNIDDIRDILRNRVQFGPIYRPLLPFSWLYPRYNGLRTFLNKDLTMGAGVIILEKQLNETNLSNMHIYLYTGRNGEVQELGGYSQIYEINTAATAIRESQEESANYLQITSTAFNFHVKFPKYKCFILDVEPSFFNLNNQTTNLRNIQNDTAATSEFKEMTGCTRYTFTNALALPNLRKRTRDVINTIVSEQATIFANPAKRLTYASDQLVKNGITYETLKIQ